MQKYLFIFSLGIIFSTTSFYQSKVADPERKDFMATLGFLSSDWMEGREAGSKGSSWFVRNFDFIKQKILLNVNFDMISRSAEEDTESKVISIGLLKGTDKLKEIANAQNMTLKKPFELDLWETSGGGGSD